MVQLTARFQLFVSLYLGLPESGWNMPVQKNLFGKSQGPFDQIRRQVFSPFSFQPLYPISFCLCAPLHHDSWSFYFRKHGHACGELVLRNRAHLQRAKPALWFIWNNRASSTKSGAVETRLSPPAMRARLSPFSVKPTNFSVEFSRRVIIHDGAHKYSCGLQVFLSHGWIIWCVSPLIVWYIFLLSESARFYVTSKSRRCDRKSKENNK